MNENPILDVAIGLVLMYLLLSMICTVVNEYIATAMKLRADTLKESLTALIDSPDLRKRFYEHGLIQGAISASGARDPSYLSGRTFALALLGSLKPDESHLVFKDLQLWIDKLPTSNIKGILLAQVAAANHNADRLRAGVETWFDSAMDRVSGVYKRKMKLASFLVGCLLAASLNADTIDIAKDLWRDPALQLEVVNVAAQDVSDDSQLDCGDSGNGSDCIVADASALKVIPIGWPGDSIPKSDEGPADWAIFLLRKAAGIILTALALSLGAPFWFDTLSKFVRIRGGGEKPARSDDIKKDSEDKD